MIKSILFSHLRSSAFICGLYILISGCGGSQSNEVVLYTSVDEPIARPIIDQFTKETHIHVTMVTDTEASKSVGLAERLRAEKSNPQCDVWWSNEIFLTINLAEEGLLAAYDSPSAVDVPAKFRDPQHRWAGNGQRIRVMVVGGIPTGPDLGPTTQPWVFTSINDLKAKNLFGKIAIARPTAGTTGGHVAALYTLWGQEAADAYFRALQHNGVKLVGGNSVVAESVAKGTLWLGLTDNDDAAAAQAEGGTLRVVVPDQSTFGTLVIPTSVGLVSGTKHATQAKALIDRLLSKQTEQWLIDAKFAYSSIRGDAGPAVKAMDIDYDAAAKAMPQAIRRATSILEGRQ